MPIDPSSVLRRNNVQLSGTGQRAMMFAHGFGCDQTMWEPVDRNFERDFRVILFDYVGHGRSDPRRTTARLTSVRRRRRPASP